MRAGSRTLAFAGLTFALIGCGGDADGARSGAPGTGPVAALTAQDVEAIREIGRNAVEEDGIVGIAVAVARDGRTVFAEGFGHADVARSVPVDENTIFDIASVGKQYTAVAILELAEQGKLDLDQRVRELVPELPEHFPDATIRQLLSMTSGFVSGELDEQNPPDDYGRKRYGLELLTDVELQTGEARFRPGEVFVYSNADYLVLGLVVEAAGGKRYDRFVRDELLDPIGLTEVSVLERVDGSRMSEAIRRTESGHSEVAYIDFTAFGGQGSICSSVVDLLRWSQALNAGRLVSAETLQAMRTPTTVRGEEAAVEMPYGHAQRLSRFFGHRKAGHTGTFDGGSAALYTYPDDGLEIAVISNTYGNGTPHAYTYEQAIARRLLEVTLPDIEAMVRPLSERQKQAAAGDYTMGGSTFTASFEGDTLVVLRDGEEQERLVHVGGLEFRRADRPEVIERFTMDGDRCGWWIYDVSGSYVEVVRRIPGR